MDFFHNIKWLPPFTRVNVYELLFNQTPKSSYQTLWYKWYMINDGIFICIHHSSCKVDKNHGFNNWDDWNAGELWNRTMHSLKYLRARGHLLSMYWRYKTNATLTLCYSSSAVHAGLQAALEDFHGGHEYSSCSSLLRVLG